MPLLRIVQHPKKNNQAIDKLIYVEGIPAHLLQVNPLSGMWSIDNPLNLPEDIRKKFNVFCMSDIPEEERFVKMDRAVRDVQGNIVATEKVDYLLVEGQHELLPQEIKDKYLKGKFHCLKLEYGNANGERIWKTIERLIEHGTPRDLPLPEPAIVGDRLNWRLKASEVPIVILTPAGKIGQTVVKPESVAMPEETKPKPECSICGKKFGDKRGISFHMKKHEREKAVA
jgi:hypothetical protein